MDRRTILHLFHVADSNGDGSISKDELRDVFRKLDASWTRPGRMESLFSAIDTNGDERIDLIEFVEWMKGQNVKVNQLIDDMSFDTLRLFGCTELSRQEIMDALQPFGTVKHLHHVQGITVETLVIYSSQAEAKAAFVGFSGSDETAQAAYQEAPATRTGHRIGGTLKGCERLCFSADSPGTVHLTSSAASTSNVESTPGNFFGELKAAVDRIHFAGSGGDCSWRNRAAHAYRCAATIPQAAAILRGLSLAIPNLRPGCEVELEKWQRTMRGMAKGQIDFMSPARISDALKELLSFFELESSEKTVRLGRPDEPVFI